MGRIELTKFYWSSEELGFLEEEELFTLQDFCLRCVGNPDATWPKGMKEKLCSQLTELADLPVEERSLLTSLLQYLCKGRVAKKNLKPVFDKELTSFNLPVSDKGIVKRRELETVRDLVTEIQSTKSLGQDKRAERLEGILKRIFVEDGGASSPSLDSLPGQASREKISFLQPVDPGLDFRGLFTFICSQEERVDSVLSERNWEILRRRFPRRGSEVWTLQSLGDELGITRERVRQLEKGGLFKLRLVLGLCNPVKLSSRKGKRYASSFVRESLYCQRWVKGCLQKNGGVLSLESLCSKIGEHFEFFGEEEVYSDGLFLVLAVLGFEILESAFGVFVFSGDRDQLRTFLERLESESGCFFLESSIVNHSDKELEVKLKKRLGEVYYLKPKKMKLCSFLRMHERFKEFFCQETGLWGAPLYEFSCNELFYWGLYQLKEPSHYQEIIDLVTDVFTERYGYSLAKMKNVRLTSYLKRDPRILPIGRSGYWTLKEWDSVCTLTIREAIGKVLLEADQPMSFEEVFEKVGALRPVARTSVQLYLHEGEDFLRSENCCWIHVDNVDQHENIWTREKIDLWIERYFQELGAGCSVQFSKIFTDFCEVSKWENNRANRIYFAHSNSIESYKGKLRKTYSRLYEDWRSRVRDCERSSSEESLFAKLHDRVESLLNEKGKLLLREVVEDFHQEFDCHKTTVYSCISEEGNIEKFQDDEGRMWIKFRVSHDRP